MSIFLTFEGGEGSGKSTQIRLLGEVFEQRKIPHLLTREPGGTELGKTIRRLLLQGDVGSMDALTELMLYAADRAEHVRKLIQPALAEKKIVLCDRFTDATLAYQGYGRGLDRQRILELNTLATGGLKPKLTFLLDCPVEIGLARSNSRLKGEGSGEDRFEREHLGFHQKVRSGYLELAKKDAQRFVVLDATQKIEDLHHAILQKVDGLLKGGARG